MTTMTFARPARVFALRVWDMARTGAYLTALTLCLLAPQAGQAQSRDETLADIRQELTVLYVEIQKLKRELSTSGNTGGASMGGTSLDRLNALETEVQRLTSKTENLEFRINQIVRDGTNRIGDLEFRLVELEGGDISQLGETTTLGGDIPANSGAAAASPAPAPASQVQSDGAQLAMAEEQDFKRAQTAFDAGDYAKASQAYQDFLTAYPGSPMQARAELGRGRALEAQGETTLAARAYLAAFTAAPEGPVAAESLYNLGRGLAALGQGPEACTALREVGNRFPGSDAAQSAGGEITRLGCP